MTIYNGKGKPDYQDYLFGFKTLGYAFRTNMMDESIEVNGELLTDGILAVILSQMIDGGYTSRPGIELSIQRSAEENKYHPIKEYFSTHQWNGEDTFSELMNYFQFQHDQFAKNAIKKWLLGAVAKVLNAKQNYMLVLDGEQGIGKSYLAEWLCPLPDFFIEGALNPDSNDTKLRIMKYWIWEVGELQYTTRKADIEALKNIVTQSKITARRPYGRFDIVKPAVASFIGTINETGAGFLNDPTGTRRFATVKINSLDHAYTEIDKDQLWSQIYFEYINGASHELDKMERAAQEKVNEEYELVSPLQEMLERHYDIDPNEDVYLPAINIITWLEECGLKGSQRINLMELASIMKKLGVIQIKNPQMTGHGYARCYKGVQQKF